ncbi:hypothetical protein TREVI0001_2288 [Treponema vincentii ATCC 35580]|uniref:Uncharacterized protein n=1 Tax=Treponema vincentii ATCC 35580 TaxID=596324 RepID=C8PLY7_9SPIR|nr:hypothetical protein TREVI0001_2288 [Treponema vincentii ATCC 35580]
MHIFLIWIIVHNAPFYHVNGRLSKISLKKFSKAGNQQPRRKRRGINPSARIKAERAVITA